MNYILNKKIFVFLCKYSLFFFTFGINLYSYNDNVNYIIKKEEHRSWFKWLEW